MQSLCLISHSLKPASVLGKIQKQCKSRLSKTLTRITLSEHHQFKFRNKQYLKNLLLFKVQYHYERLCLYRKNFTQRSSKTKLWRQVKINRNPMLLKERLENLDKARSINECFKECFLSKERYPFNQASSGRCW